MKETIRLTKEGIEIVKQSQTAFCDALKRKFDCTAVIHNVDVPRTSSTGSANSTIRPEMKYEKQLTKGLKISVWKDDLTAHKVDAVVNAANEQLKHGGGLALALSKAGGPEIQQTSDQIIKYKGSIPTGEAVITPAGNLSCKKIIHAVGPHVSPNPKKQDIMKAEALLEKAVWEILQITQYENLQSVAIPAISSGLYNFPRNRCANTIVKTVKKFSDMPAWPGRIMDVRLVNNDDPSVHEMQRACREILGPPDNTGHGTMSMPSQTRAPTSTAYPSVNLGNITLFIKTGAIEKEEADVIVNSVGRDLNLSTGQISTAILNKSGNKIQQEIRTRTHGLRSASYGAIIDSGPYNLKCKAVYHTVCAEKHITASDQILHSVVMGCLNMASQQGFSSISFPAVGTGSLGFQKDEISKIMISAVKEFAKTYFGKKMDIYIVIFPKDKPSLMAFEQELVLLKTLQSYSQLSPTVTSSAPDKGSAVDDIEDPYIELLANSSEGLAEARTWADNMLCSPSPFAEVKNNHIVHFGQQDHKDLLDFQAIFNVVITEFIRKGKCGISIEGERSIEVSSAAIHVEAKVCLAQDNFAQTEEEDLLHSVVRWEGSSGEGGAGISAALEKAYLADVDTVSVNDKTFKVDLRHGQARTEARQYEQFRRICFFSLYAKMPRLTSHSYYERIPTDYPFDSAERERWEKFAKCGLHIVKMEKIENYALRQVFELNRKRVMGEPQWLYQCVTAQFCDKICRVGFQREYAPPEEQRYGAGLYFTTEVERALKLWDNRKEKFIYIFEAQVLTGESIKGSPELIVPPPIGRDPLVCYNSVTSELKDIHVIFHGHQALPQFLITCTKADQTFSVTNV